jgi:signal transduction histidine kinase
MKLATRYQRSNLIITLVIFIMASVAFYALLRQKLIFQVDEDLEIEQHEIEAYVARFGTMPNIMMPVEDQVVQVVPARKALPRRIRRTVKLYDAVEGEAGDFRQLVFTIDVGGSLQQVSVSKSLEATRGLTRSIGLIALVTIAVMLALSTLINRIILQRLWKPFYDTIGRLRSFDLGLQPAIELPNVTVDEFALLNTTLTTVTGKAAADYKVLKEFTENAAHELQTPLAIVRSKLDLFIQDEALSEQQSRLIQDAYEGLQRLTHLNQSLLQLAKIEGGHYMESSMVDIKALIAGKIADLDDMLRDQGLQVHTVLSDCSVTMNATLADLLLNNLLTNAIRHNRSEGRINISLDAERLSICNTSNGGPLAEADLFARFSKTSDTSNGTGLGLAISKQICEASGCAITYAFSTKRLHCFTVLWSEAGRA